MKEWVIYLWVNQVNQKKYVGQSYEFEQRVTGHLSLKGNSKGKIPMLSSAIWKYGLGNFTLEIIHEEIYTKREANRLEAQYIKFYNCRVPLGHGYNIRGEDDNVNTINDITKKKLAKVHQKRQSLKNKTGFIGVKKGKDGYFSSVARINKTRKSKNFKTAQDAAEAYDKIVLFVYGPDAKLNFPEKLNDYLLTDLDEFHRFFIAPSVTKISNYKWIKPRGEGWAVNFAKRPGIPRLSFTTYTEGEAVQIADKIAFFFLNIPVKELNFPEEAKAFNREDLEIFFQVHERPKKQSSYKGIGNSGVATNPWAAYFFHKGKQYHVGHYSTELEAFNAREEFIKNFKANLVAQETATTPPPESNSSKSPDSPENPPNSPPD